MDQDQDTRCAEWRNDCGALRLTVGNRAGFVGDDGRTHLLVEGHVAQELPNTSVFGSLNEASDFFERGSLGYSVTARPGRFDGLELHSFNWQVQPLVVERGRQAVLVCPHDRQPTDDRRAVATLQPKLPVWLIFCP